MTLVIIIALAILAMCLLSHAGLCARTTTCLAVVIAVVIFACFILATLSIESFQDAPTTTSTTMTTAITAEEAEPGNEDGYTASLVAMVESLEMKVISAAMFDGLASAMTVINKAAKQVSVWSEGKPVPGE